MVAGKVWVDKVGEQTFVGEIYRGIDHVHRHLYKLMYDVEGLISVFVCENGNECQISPLRINTHQCSKKAHTRLDNL